MTHSWTEPARLMVARLVDNPAAAGLPGLWSLAKAAQRAALRVALDPSADADLAMTYAAMDLGELLEELEWADPALPTRAVAVDLGEPLENPAACREVVAALLVGALEVAAVTLRSPVGESTGNVLMLARVVHLITSAHLRVAGRLP